MTDSSPPGRLDGDVAIVTGSTRGIGASVAKRLAAEGASVVVSGRTVPEGEATAEDIQTNGGEATFVRADMRDPAAIERLVETAAETYGTITTIINNAAVQTETTAAEATLDDWAFVLETDFRGYWLTVKHAIEHMPDGGSIVNVSSNHAFLTMPGTFPYNAVKAGINGMTRAFAVELGPLGIRANTINPGWVEVARTRAELEATDRERIESIHPLGRIGTPEDVAGVVAFLASDDAAFVTGASLRVDGGRTAVMEDQPFRDHSSRFEG
ncbi:SDR family oxidoreductase (plasmid) [Halococcus dombrowskii]|uniref:SDR family oxidoreductase n=1 Tax=Halococcus dombrowskii TaxID=179637 RepID=A0AAV3SE67_HALDO|nr:SDR family NAD(P)-dependent oxidoreductase [Halococcus dombrowskii]UOO96651.1 SDR family oxidoreductase [Halococcus dombrowskii]